MKSMGFEMPKEKTIAGWAEYSLKMAAQETDPVGKEAYRKVAERLTKFPYNSGLMEMREAEYQRILGWNKIKARVFKRHTTEPDRPTA